MALKVVLFDHVFERCLMSEIFTDNAQSCVFESVFNRCYGLNSIFYTLTGGKTRDCDEYIILMYVFFFKYIWLLNLVFIEKKSGWD